MLGRFAGEMQALVAAGASIVGNQLIEPAGVVFVLQLVSVLVAKQFLQADCPAGCLAKKNSITGI